MDRKPSREGERLRVLSVGEASPDQVMPPRWEGAPEVVWRSAPGDREAVASLREEGADLVILRASGSYRGCGRVLKHLRGLDPNQAPLVFLLVAEGGRIPPLLRAGADACLLWRGSSLAFFEVLRSLYWRFSCRFPRALASLRQPEAGEGVLPLDPKTRSIYLRGRWIPLTPIEHRILQCLAETPGVPLDARALMVRVWGDQPPGCGEPPLRWHVRNLRAKLEEDPLRPRILRTLSRRGYALVPPREADLLPEGALPEEGREVLEAIAEVAADPFVVADEAWRVVLWNREAERIFGYRREEVLGRDLRDPLFPEERGGDLWRRWADRTRHVEGFEGDHRVEVEACTRSGQRRCLEMVQSGFSLWGRRYRLAVFRPAPRRETLAPPVWASPSLSVAEHEIRHLAQAILGFSQLALASQSPEGRQEHVEGVSRAAHSLSRVLRDYSLLSRIRAWEADPAEQTFHPQELLDRLLRQARDRLDREGRFLDLHAREETGLTRLRGDPERLYQILWPLLEEALESADEEGVDLTVRGEEIPDGTLELRFDVRSRAEGTRRSQETSPEKLVIGLPEGELRLQRHPDGERSRAFVLRERQDPQDRDPRARRHPELEGRRVQVVSLRTRSRRHLEWLFASWGMTVCPLSSETEPPEVAVWDRLLPPGGESPWSRVPLLLLVDPEQPLPEGMAGEAPQALLGRPLCPDRLREALKGLLVPGSLSASGVEAFLPDLRPLREALRLQQPHRCREHLEALRKSLTRREGHATLDQVEGFLANYRFDEAVRCLEGRA